MKVLFWQNSEDNRESWTSKWLCRPNDDRDLEELSGSNDVGTLELFNDEICELLSKWNDDGSISEWSLGLKGDRRLLEFCEFGGVQ